MKEFIFTWSIENISYSWHKTREKIVSPKFFAHPIQNSNWTLRLYPRGFENGDYLSLFLRRETDSSSENLAVNFELSCISADTSSVQARFIPETLKTFTKEEELGFGELRFLKRHEVFGRRKALYLPQDTLTLRCRMWKNEEDNEFGQLFARTRLTIDRKFSDADIRKSEIPTYKIVDVNSENNKLLVSISISSYDDHLDIEIHRVNEKLKKFTTLNVSFVEESTERKLCEYESVWFHGPQNEVFSLPFSVTLQNTENDNSEESFIFRVEIVHSTGEELKIIETDYQPRIPEFLSNYIISCVPSGKLTEYPSISEDLWNLYKKQILCDVELKTKDRSFLAHKLVLCARSSVFVAMLSDEMKEKENGCIEIEDISAETLEKFLNFLYTDAFDYLEWNTVAELYYAADKYQVELLRLLCSSHLRKNVDVDNVCAFLVLADQFNDYELRQKVDDFIWKDEERIFKSSSWKKFANEQSQLAVKCMLSKYEEKESQSPTEIFVKISSHPKFLDDLRSFYQSQIVSDIVIKTASASYPAHKTVLCAYSSIFKDMLSNDLRDKSTDFIEIEDLEDDTVSRMLFFLHTDEFEDLQWDNAKKLYHASVVYQIHRLKFNCSCFLLKNLRVPNACDLLVFALEHSDLRLKSAVEDYICVYDEEIFTSNEWAKLSETNLLLANEIMSAKYKKNQRNYYS